MFHKAWWWQTRPLCTDPPQSFLFGQSAEIAIELDGEDKRKKVDVKNEEGKKEKLSLYFDGESVSGKVHRLWHCFVGVHVILDTLRHL